MVRPTRKRAVIFTETPPALPYSGVVVGPVRVIHPVLIRLEIPWQWCHNRHGYKVPRQHLADLEAALTADGYRVVDRGGVLL